jgi:DNA topoisomerase-1
MGYTLIIAEKPDAARRIAEALAEKNSLRSFTNKDKVTYYEFERNGKKHVVVCAVGHLFNLAPLNKDWSYPIFNYTWKPSFQVSKDSAFSKKYFDVVKSLLPQASEYIIATDYDTEGEVIGANVLRFLAGKNDAKRMKFSTLTKDELIEAYENILPHIDFGQLEAGLTRHELDWLWGINLTRALTLALKRVAEKGFAILSSGRVQSPTLNLILERELEIRKFKPKPFWQLELHAKVDGNKIVAMHEKEKFWKKEEVDKVLNECKGKDAIVEKIKKKEYRQKPPFPFNTTDLQAEAYAAFKFSPAQTLQIAESLYQQGYCVTGDTLIPLSDGKIVTIKELVENKNCSSLPAIREDLKSEITTIEKYWKLPYNGKLVEIILKNNDKITLTPEHRLLVLRKYIPEWVPASEIKIGDFVAVPNKINVRRKKDPSCILEVFELFNDKEKTKVLFNLRKEFAEIIKNRIKKKYKNLIEINKHFNYKPVTFYARFNRSHLSFDIIKWLLDEKIISIEELEKNTISYFWAAETAKPLALPFYFTEDLCYFIGLIAADGHCSESGVSFPNIKKLARTVEEYIEKLKLGGWKGEKTIGFKSKLFVKILNHLGIPSGNKAHKIDIPNLILIQPDRLIWSYIAGFFDGDGSVKLKKNKGRKSFSIRIAFTSKSEIFLRKLKSVLLSYGITSYIYQDDLLIYSDDCEIISSYILPFLKIRRHEWKYATASYTTKKRFRHEHRLIPIDSTILRKILEKNNFSLREISKKIGINICNQILRKAKFQKSSLSKLAKLLNDKLLLLLAEGDVIWKPVIKINFKKNREKYVYDVTTGFGCFIGNSIILHNCSYPRTSSQKLPPSIGYEKILKALASLKPYEKFAKELLKKEKLIPNNGPKDDVAHPCIYATHEVPDLSKLTSQQKKIYDLIVRRTLATFAEEALRESVNAILAIGGNKFIAVGRRTIKPGWTEIYSPYLALEEQILPELKVGQTVKVIKIDLLAKETQPPPRYSQGSIIKELEKRNLGTKCITGDTKIPILNGSKFHEISIEKLFNKEKSFKYQNEKILLNQDKLCFCVNDKNVTTSKFNLITRRKLEKNEKVFEITFEDNSKIKITEDHPLLVYNDKLTYIPAKKVSKGMKVVSSFLYYDKFGNLISWNDFVRKLNPKSKLYGCLNLKEWRKNKGLTQKEIGKILGLRQATIAGWEKKMSVPLWVWSKLDLPLPKTIYSVNKKINLQNPFPIVISSNLIRILAHLMGDGSLDREKLKRENCFDFRYTNKNFDLVKLFVSDVEKVFKMNKKIEVKTDKRDKNKFYVKLPSILGRILSILFKGLISKKINIDEKFYPDFIGAIFDDEGHSYKDETKIFISNTNIYLIKNLEKYLKKLGFTPYVREEKLTKKHKSYKIFLYGRDVAKFLEEIPFFHKIKKERIVNNLSKKYNYKGQPYLLLEKKVFSYLPKQGATLKEIAFVTSLPLNTVKTCIKNLKSHGYVGVKIVGIHQQPKKKILYIPLKECCKTFYSFLGENVISPTLITKTVRNVAKINYKGYVYDIMNNLTSNFILGNNIVVHNSTRAEILQILYDRRYIVGKSIQVTKLGEVVAKTLKELVPNIVSEELTRHFEKEMEQVFNGKKKREEVVEEAKEVLKEILEEFKSKEDKIGKKLLEGLVISRKEERKIGVCPNCGGELRIIFSKKSGKRFVGCSNYPKCKTGFPLPLVGQITALNKNCEVCGLPMIQVWRKGKRPFRMCINPNCESKKDWNRNTQKN